MKIWGWKKRERLERMQERNIKWCLGVDYNTTGYAVIEEVGRRRLCIGTDRRTMKFDTKMAKCEEGSIMKECWKKWAEKKGLESRMG